jgi:hypothetical protein
MTFGRGGSGGERSGRGEGECCAWWFAAAFAAAFAAVTLRLLVLLSLGKIVLTTGYPVCAASPPKRLVLDANWYWYPYPATARTDLEQSAHFFPKLRVARAAHYASSTVW